MKAKLFACCMAFCCMLLTAYGQRFQITTGSANPDEKWAVVEDPAVNGYVAIGNTVFNNQSEVWISSYTLNGVVVSSARASNNRPMIVRDISIAPPNAAGNPTYYVTGWTQIANSITGAIVNQMFVGRIDLTGAFLWYQENPLNGNGEQKEGIAVATAPNGDVVAVGDILRMQAPGGFQVYLCRFTPAGALLWGNSYDAPGRWLPREINNAVPSPGCIPSPDQFIITGEAYNVNGLPGPVTFAAHYSGAGVECWRNIYPAAAPNITTNGDAGYDVVYEPQSGNYCIAAMAQINGGPRNGPNSTPYMLTIAPNGAMVTSSVYFDPATLLPLGIYPRSVSLGANPGEVVVSGPAWNNNRVFLGLLANINAPLPQFLPLREYTGAISATANSYAQPFWFFDAQPEDVIYTNGNVTPGYLISTNNWPVGVYGQGDGHFIKTDAAGFTPNNCPPVDINNKPDQSMNAKVINTIRVQNINFGFVPTIRNPHPVDQKDCRDDCVVTAGFTYTATGNTVVFTNGSAGNGALSYSWNFGDGPPAGTSTATNPLYTYAAAGNYYVCLTVTNVTQWGDTCTATFCDTVRLNTCNINADFNIDSIVCKTVYVTSTATGTGPFTYQWQFDGTPSGSGAGSSFTFSNCGPHTVQLIVCNGICCDTIVKNINVPCCTISPAFNFCLTPTGTSVLINTNTEPGASYTVFVNGAATGFPANGSFTLPLGNNTVCVRARKIYCGDTCCAVVCKTIRIADTCNLNGNFWFQVRSNNQVQFTNQSTPAGFTSFWQFGDAANSTSTLTSPLFTYPGPGTYTACLTVRRINGTDTCEEKVCKTIVIDPPCNVLANFRATYCTQTPLTVTFTNMSIGGVTYEWNFGDPLSGVNNTSTAANPSHNFTAAGTYTVCLKTLVNANCWSRACFRVVVSTTTTSTSCTVLPANPAFRQSDALVAENEVTLVDQANSNGKPPQPVLSAVTAKAPPQTGRLLLFPNPVSQKVNAVFAMAAAATAEIWVMNNAGEAVYKKILPVVKGANQLSIPVSGFAAGMYYLRIQTPEGTLKNQFVVQKE